MKSIKNEFIEHVDNKIIKCAEIIKYQEDFMRDCPDDILGNEKAIMNWLKERKSNKYYLGIDDTREDYQFFLKALDINLKKDERMIGTIWYTDGSWSRYRYDWYDEEDLVEYSYWEHVVVPEIPEICKAL